MNAITPPFRVRRGLARRRPRAPHSLRAGWSTWWHSGRHAARRAGFGRESASARNLRREPLDASCNSISAARGSARRRAGTAHNNTDALIRDIEALRERLGIERWLVAGGSWGATLALAYAARHRERTSGVLLRGVFLASDADLDWFFDGVASLAPEAHQEFIAHVPRSWRRSTVAWLDRCLSRGDPRCAEIAAAWQRYELRLDRERVGATMTAPSGDSATRLIAKYRVQAHYLARRCFLNGRAVLHAASMLRGVPVAIVHGEHDWICPPRKRMARASRCRGQAASRGLRGRDTVRFIRRRSRSRAAQPTRSRRAGDFAGVAAAGREPMSLRFQINLLLAGVIAVFTIVVLAFQLLDTRRSVREETEAANRVATHLLGFFAGTYAQATTPIVLESLERLGRVRSNEIMLRDDAGNEVYHSPPSPYKQGRNAPAWYAALVAPEPQTSTMRFLRFDADRRIECVARSARWLGRYGHAARLPGARVRGRQRASCSGSCAVRRSRFA